MKRDTARVAERPATLTRGSIPNGILVVLFLILSGCAAVPRQPPQQPVTIDQEKASPGIGAATADKQPQKEPGDQTVAALVALLKSKNVISAEEAAGFAGKPPTPGPEEKKSVPGKPGKTEPAAAAPEWSERVRYGGDMRLRSEKDRFSKEAGAADKPGEPAAAESKRGPSEGGAAVSEHMQPKRPVDQEIATLVALLKSKNVITAEEAARLTGQPPAEETQKPSIVIAEAGGQEQVDKITARATEQVMLHIQDQVKKQVREELAKEIQEHQKEQIETITASVSREIKKTLPEQPKGEVRIEPPASPAGKEQSQKVAQVMTEEMKKDLEEQVKTQVKEEVAKEIKEAGLTATVLDWIKRIRFGGDMRLRYEWDNFDEENALLLQPSNPNQLLNTQADRDAFRYRLRLGAEIDVMDELETVVRFSTGNESNPVSTNEILGDFMNKDNIVIDQAYVKWKPWQSLHLYGGRIPNPWFSSDLVWDTDLNFEGVAVKFRKPLSDSSWAPFLTVGAFPLQDDDFSTESKWLTAGQVGLEKINPKGVAGKLGVSYYNFSNITGVRNDPANPGATDWTAPLYQQKGNTLFNIDASGGTRLAYASEFRELNITGMLDLGFWDPVHVVLLGDYVKNLGFDKGAVSRRTGDPDQPKDTTGYQIGLSVGYPKIEKLGQWRAHLNYKYLGGDAVVDAFTDSDFHLGGTNAKGWIMGLDFGLAKKAWLTLKWLSSDEINGPPLAIDVFQADVNIRF